MGEAKRRNVDKEALEFFRTPAVRIIQAFSREKDPAYQWLAKLLHACKRFHLPFGGNLLEMESRESLVDEEDIFFRLPFPHTLAEFQLEDLGDQKNRYMAVAMFEMSPELRDEIVAHSVPAPPFSRTFARIKTMDAGELSEWVAVIMANHLNGEFGACPTLVMVKASKLRFRRDEGGLLIGHKDEKWMTASNDYIAGRILPDKLMQCQVYPDDPGSYHLREFLHDILMSEPSINETHIALQIFIDLCTTLNCSNVRAHVHVPPKDLCHQNLMENRTPYSEFRVLVVDGMPIEMEVGEVLPSGRIGKPKKAHFRKGHPRVLADGRKVWVRWCEVGARQLGTIHKVYDLTKR